MKPLYRAIRINHANLQITHLGDYILKDDAQLRAYEDRADEPAPDKDRYFAWYVVSIEPTLRRENK